MDAWALSACYPRSTFYPMSNGDSTFHRWITRSYFRNCSTCLSYSKAHLYPYALRMITNHAECTFELLRYTLGGNRPSQTDPLTLFLAQIHGIEVIGRMPVLYSLGNFVMEKKTVKHGESDLSPGLATQWAMSPEAVIAVLEITKGELISLYIFPILLDTDGFPTRADSAVSEKILRDIETYPPGPITWEKVRNAALLRFQ